VHITENTRVRQGLSWDNAVWACSTFHTGTWHPLTWFSHMLDVEMFGLNPAGHHGVNLLLHCIAALLLFGFLRSATGQCRSPALVAALFALHPLHVESVAWAAERKDVLSAVFWFAALWAYTSYARRPCFGRYSAVLAFFALGLMAKPILATLPFVLLLLDFWPLGRRPEERNTVPFLLAEKIPLFALGLASAIITLVAQHEAIGGLTRTGIGARAANAAVSYIIYIWQMVWPAGLAVYYPIPLQPPVTRAAAAALALVSATAAVLWAGRRKPYLVTGWFWYIVTLIPVIGIIQAGDQSHADRCTYLPLTGLFIMAAWAADGRMTSTPVLKRSYLSVAVSTLVVLGILTHTTVSYWENDLTLFGRAVAAVRGNYPMKVKLGDALNARGKTAEAMREFRESLAIRPSAYAYAAIGAVYQTKGELEQALEYYHKALAVKPGIRSAFLNAGKILVRLGRFDEAGALMREATATDPSWCDAYLLLGQSLIAAGRLEEGENAFRQAVALEPARTEARQGLGNALALRGDYAAAAEEYRKDLRSGRNSLTLANLGACLSALGRKEDAVDAYRESLAREPENAETRYGLAIVLADLGRKAEAMEELRQAMSLAPQNGEIRELFQTLSGDSR
jgi:tetratricopeptide (TPR) repeat protein